MSLRQEMLAYFQQPQINAKILDYVASHNLDIQELDENKLMQLMEDLQLVGDIQNRMSQQQETSYQGKNGTHKLIVTITKGRKFKPLQDLPKSASFYFYLSGFSQKVKSCSYPVAQNFSISQKISLNLKESLLRSNNNQNVQLIAVAVIDNKKILYSIKLIQWRFVLVYGSISIDIQLAPYHHDGLNTMPCAGILSIVLQITPLPKHHFLSEVSLRRQLDLQQKTTESANNKFHSYANNFWNQIKSVHRNLQTRRIPIYAQTEDKVYYALPRMISPLYGIRGIDSPHHALRFCSLIPFCQAQLNRQASFRRFSSMLCGQQGTIEDHCHLLCSLLLGLGLKAFVCVGMISKGEHSWVMTQSTNSVTFWECTKGIKLDYFSPKSLTFYKTINVVYNNKEYFANIQLDDSVSGTKFNFREGTLWKKMDEGMLAQLPAFNKGLSLTYPNLNPYLTEQNIQSSLAELIRQFRVKSKLSFNFDQILSSLLTTALSNYEIERVTGSTFCQQQFQTAIKSYIPAKHTFKAFPIQLTTLDPQDIFAQIQHQEKARQILQISGQSVYFAVRTKMVVFPDNVFALWLSLAVRFYRIN